MNLCPQLQEAINSANRNTDAMAKTIDALDIPCNYKGVFMHLADERGFRFDKETLTQMEAIGITGSEVCLMLLEGNHKQAGLIVAYRLATELENDQQRAMAVEIIYDSGSKTINQNAVLLAILTILGQEAKSA